MIWTDDDELSMEGVERGCGVREPGGIYAEFPLVRGGRGDVKRDYMCDPPIALGGLELPPRGVTIMERPGRPGVYDVWDWIGAQGYPGPADMIEEVIHLGLSRRLSKSLDFSLLTPGSLIILVHPRAIITNRVALYRMLAHEAIETPHAVVPWLCPTCREDHAALLTQAWESDEGDEELALPMCAGLWWENLIKAEPNYDLTAPRRSCFRQSGSTRYAGRHVPHGFTPEYEPGIIARFPITRLAVVTDEEGDESAKAMMRLQSTTLPVREVDF